MRRHLSEALKDRKNYILFYVVLLGFCREIWWQSTASQEEGSINILWDGTLWVLEYPFGAVGGTGDQSALAAITEYCRLGGFKQQKLPVLKSGSPRSRCHRVGSSVLGLQMATFS